MRKNVEVALRAFMRGESARPSTSVWSDGTALYSYGTAILTTAGAGEDSRYILNVTPYSVTTTTQQNALRAYLPDRLTVTVSGVPRGADLWALRRRAYDLRKTIFSA